MDPFNDNVEDDEKYEEQDDSMVDKSFSSRHSNGGEADFNRVSLADVGDTPKSVANDSVNEKDIDFKLESFKKPNNDLEVNDHHDPSADNSMGQNKVIGEVQNKRHGFDPESDSDEDNPDRKGKGNQHTIMGVFFP